MPLVAEVAKDDEHLVVLRLLRVYLRPQFRHVAPVCDQSVLGQIRVDLGQPGAPLPRPQLRPEIHLVWLDRPQHKRSLTPITSTEKAPEGALP